MIDDYRFQIVKCEGTEIRVFVVKGWYGLNCKDVCTLLNYSDMNQALSLLDKNNFMTSKHMLKTFGKDLGKVKLPKTVLSGDIFVNHTGFNILILNSNSPKAIEFKKWISRDVLQILDITSPFESKWHLRVSSPFQILGIRMLDDNYMIPKNCMYILNIEKTLFYVGYSSTDLYVESNKKKICEIPFDHVVYIARFPDHCTSYTYLEHIKDSFSVWSEKQFLNYDSYLNDDKVIIPFISPTTGKELEHHEYDYGSLMLFETEEYSDVGKILDTIDAKQEVAFDSLKSSKLFY